MDVDARTEELRNLAAVMILGASGLTDELTDAEARSLLDRCLVQAEAAVDALTVRFDLAWLPVEEAREMIAERVAPVRRWDSTTMPSTPASRRDWPTCHASNSWRISSLLARPRSPG